MTLNAHLRYFVHEYHERFVLLIVGKEYVDIFFLIQILTPYFDRHLGGPGWGLLIKE